MKKENKNEKITNYIINDMLANSAMGVDINSDFYIAALQDEVQANLGISFVGNENQIKNFIQVMSNNPAFKEQVSKMTVEQAMNIIMMQNI